ncbi:MAG: ADP-dependent glucokinase/phosphofructokinase [Atribacterota bacterium]|nr:hypothetical protein [Candidatus Atribacteria bacterium]
MTLYDILLRSLSAMERGKDIFCSYSGNVDWVIPVEKERFLYFQKSMHHWPKTFTNSLHQPALRTMEDLINYVTYFLHMNCGGEGDLLNTELVSTVMETLPGYFAIGGTGAQAANYLSHAGYTNIYLHLPIFTSYFKDLLSPTIHIFENNDYYENRMGKDIYSLSEIHCIIDFAIGAAYQIADDILHTTRPDRVILSHDRCNSSLHISESFVEELNKPHPFISFLISGFNTLRNIGDLHHFARENENIIHRYRQAHPGNRSIHVEEGDHWEREEERRSIVFNSMYPLVDSIGMNEKEFSSIMSYHNFSASEPFSGLYGLIHRYGLKRVNVHTSQSCYVVSSYPVEQELLAIGLGILLSSARAYYGTFVEVDKLEQLIKETKSLSTSRTIPPAQKMSNGYYSLTIPTLQGMKIVSSLGLGDAFTAGVMAYL